MMKKLGLAVALSLLLAACGEVTIESATVEIVDPTAIESESESESDPSDEEPTNAADTTTTSEPPTTRQPPTTEAQTETTTKPAPASEFRSPSGNIHCRVDLGTARCSHRGNTPWKSGGTLPTWASGLSFGFSEAGCIEEGFVGFDVSESGRPAAACGADMVEAADNTLAYGDALTIDGITCQSQRFGVTCLNREGNGFRLATNEIAMLYQRSQAWVTDTPSTANENLRFDTVASVSSGTLIETASGSAKCYLATHSQPESFIASAECRSIGSGGPDDDWSPDQRSCQGADFNGYNISTGPDTLGTATFGCTTDVGPLTDPTTPSQPIEPGTAVSIGDIVCGNTAGSLACHSNGTGVLVSPQEVSFFYQRDL